MTPEPLEALLKSDLRELPFLKGALQRHLQELPWTTDGLSLTERQALAALAKGPRTAGQLFADAQLKTRSAALHGRPLLLVGGARPDRGAAAARRGQRRHAPRRLASPGAAIDADRPGLAGRQARLAGAAAAGALGRRHSGRAWRAGLALEPEKSAGELSWGRVRQPNLPKLCSGVPRNSDMWVWVATNGSPTALRPSVTVVRPGRSKRSPLGW